ELGRQMTRFCAYDLLRIDAGDIAGAEKAYISVDVIGVVDAQLDRDRHSSSGAVIEGIGRLYARRGSLSDPRKENIVCGRDSHNHLVRRYLILIHPQDSSDNLRIVSVAARAGFCCFKARSASSASV